MGAWGIEPFENDEVLDWWEELNPPDLGALLDDLDRETGGLKASATWEWEMLIAAADIVATALGELDGGLPEETRTLWEARTVRLAERLARAARQ